MRAPGDADTPPAPTQGDDRDNSQFMSSLIPELSNLKETARSHENALYDLQKQVADLLEQMSNSAPAPPAPPERPFQTLMLTDFLEIQHSLERLAENISRMQEENQQKLDEFYLLVPLLIRYSWERWLVVALLCLCLLCSAVGTIYTLKHRAGGDALTPRVQPTSTNK